MTHSDVSHRNRAPSQARKPVTLSPSLQARLNAYAMVAGAAGVAVLACSQAAEAAPVCKKLTVQLFHSNTYALNPASQVFAPFNLGQSTNYDQGYGYSSSRISWNRAFFSPNSAGANVLLDAKGLPVDLSAGARIGPGGQFGKGASYGLLFTYGKGPGPSSLRGTLLKHQGNFDVQQNNLVGFQFSQSGQNHYGWARLHISVQPTYWGKRTLIKILGYGYETTPNTAIAAGNCAAVTASNAGSALGDNGAAKNMAASSVSPGATLGLLAGGGASRFKWRKDLYDKGDE